MADVKISELPIATSIASPDVAPIVQGGVTKKADVSLFGVSSNASLVLHSSGDSNDPVTHPYTFTNSGIIVKDANNAEVLRLWATDPVNDIGSLYIGAKAGENSIEYSGGGQAQTAVGFHSLAEITVGSDNTALGVYSGEDVVTGIKNVFIGMHTKGDDDSSHAVAIGFRAQVFSEKGIAIGEVADADENAISIGYGVSAPALTIHIGNVDQTDAYFAEGNAILHGKGDAIVFPDSDPHIAGAGYWDSGVLTRSAG